MTRVLGAILAGGRSRRFGSDKALALLDGRTLIHRVAAALSPQVDGVVVVGRVHPGMACAPDRPGPDLGPLGGIAGALHHARAHGFDQVLSVPCDAPDLPRDLGMLLDAGRIVRPDDRAGPQAIPPADWPASACLADLPVVGLWPVAALPELDALLAGSGSHSVRAFAARIGACIVAGPTITNVNTPDDLARVATQRD